MPRKSDIKEAETPSGDDLWAIAKPGGYQSMAEGEISFDGGERIMLLRPVGNNVWVGRTEDGQEGLFPMHTVDPIKQGPAGASPRGPTSKDSGGTLRGAKKNFLKDKIGAIGEKAMAATKVGPFSLTPCPCC